MKTAIALILAFVSGSVFANAAEITIHTPTQVHYWAVCNVHAIDMDRHSTIATVGATCKSVDTSVQEPGWAPEAHPDGAPLLFVSRIAVDGVAWIECEMTHLSIGVSVGSVTFECLSDITE